MRHSKARTLLFRRQSDYASAHLLVSLSTTELTVKRTPNGKLSSTTIRYGKRAVSRPAQPGINARSVSRPAQSRGTQFVQRKVFRVEQTTVGGSTSPAQPDSEES